MKIVKVLCSDLLRTKQTAECVVRARSQPLEIVENDILREREFGDLKGTSYDKLQPELFHPKSDFAPPNGENWATFHERVNSAWDWVLHEAKSSIKTPDDVVLVVTHGLVKSSLAQKIWKHKDWINFENTSVSTVTVTVPHEILTMNCVSHLENARL